MQHDACPQLCICAPRHLNMPVEWPQASTAWAQICMLAVHRAFGARIPSAVCCTADVKRGR